MRRRTTGPQDLAARGQWDNGTMGQWDRDTIDLALPAINLAVNGIAHSAQRMARTVRNTQHVTRLQFQSTLLVRFR